MADSPIRDVPFGTALKLSLDNYYDLLKTYAGGLGAEEYLQLKLVADPVGISSKNYRWFSYYQLLKRSDQAIAPTPISGVVQTDVSDLASVYERFLRQLRKYVVIANLSFDDRRALDECDVRLDALRDKLRAWGKADRQDWKDNCEALGYAFGDSSAYIQWSNYNGHLRDIQKAIEQMREIEFDQRTILDKKYPEASDREVVNAEFDFYNPFMRVRYPIHPDSTYPGVQFSLPYLAGLPIGSTALYDDRRVITWDNLALEDIETKKIGKFSAESSRDFNQSKSIETDWNASANFNYGPFVTVRASASEHKEITEDFKHAQSLTLSAAASFKLKIGWPSWFKPTLFSHPRVKANIHDFEPFFGKKGLSPLLSDRSYFAAGI
jgi:hypothetical protein